METKNILSNQIDKATFDYDLLSKDFQLYGVKKTKLNYNTFKYEVNKLFTPLASFTSERRLYPTLVIVEKYKSIDTHDAIVFKKLEFKELSTYELLTLLIRVTSSIFKDKKYFTYADSLHIPISTIKKSHGHIIKCHEVNIAEYEGKCFLQIKGATFTPKHWHNKSKQPSVLFHKFLDELGDIEYIKKAFRNKKQSYVSLDINDYKKFKESKAHTISVFLNDLIANKYLSFELKRLDGEHTHYSNEISSQKKEIETFLNIYGINVINVTSETEVTELLTARLKEIGLKCNNSDSSPTIIIGYNKDAYKDKEDPKEKYKTKCPSSQYVTVDRLISNDEINPTILSVLINELYIKHQNTIGFIESAKEHNHLGVYLFDKEASSIDCMIIKKGHCVFKSISEIDLFEFDLNIPYEANYEKPLIIDWEKDTFYNFVQTPMVALPESESLKLALSEKQKAQFYGIDKDIIQEYLNVLKNKIITKDTNLLIDKLEQILEQSTSSVINESSLKGIQNKGKENQLFYTWLREAHSINLKPKLKQGKDGYLNSYLGTFFDYKTNQYFSGAPKNPDSKFERYCVFRKISTNEKIIPTWIPASMQHFYIRNKQATVMPYLFKHLREWQLLKTL